VTGLLRAGLGVVAAAVLAGPLEAQVSVYSVVGLGFPREPIGVRARSLGGGVAALDPRSALNPAASTAFRTLTVAVTSNVTRREYEIDGTAATGLSETRFPFGVVGATIRGTPISFAASFATYVDRSYDLTIRDTISLRGEDIPITDRLRSRGAVVDSRLALGWAASRRLSLGVGAHVLSGSARITAARVFGNANYAVSGRRVDEAFSGFGISGGFLADPVGGVRVGAAVRANTSLDLTRDAEDVGTVGLPISVTGGVLLTPLPTIRWSVSAVWRSWSRSGDFVNASSGGRAFDTWFVGSGIEVGGTGIPLRLGFRYNQLPFSPSGDQPREISLAVGSGIRFAENRALADVAVERTLRDGGGAAERLWQLSFSLLLQP
jgi:hypothetical protein